MHSIGAIRLTKLADVRSFKKALFSLEKLTIYVRFVVLDRKLIGDKFNKLLSGVLVVLTKQSFSLIGNKLLCLCDLGALGVNLKSHQNTKNKTSQGNSDTSNVLTKEQFKKFKHFHSQIISQRRQHASF